LSHLELVGLRLTGVDRQQLRWVSLLTTGLQSSTQSHHRL